MQKEELFKYLDNPSALNEYSMSDLSAVMKKYPFFQTAYALFILNVKNIDDPRFKEFLKRYSVYVKDRERLFQLLNILESYKASYFEGVVPKDKADEETSAETSPDDTNKDVSSSEVKPEKEQTKPNPKEQKEYTTEYLRSRIDRTLSQQRDEADKKGKLSDEINTEFFILDKADQITERVAKRYTQELKSEEKDNTSAPDDVFELEENPEEQIEEPKTEEQSGIKLPGGQYFTETSYQPDQSDKNDLIDQFLQNNPDIERIEPDTSEKGDISTQSVEENDDLLTEKLAHLYIKQGYFKKAIDAYQKLSLKYPEKSDYFAEQIKRIKQINNEK